MGKEILDTYEGTNGVKQSKINLLTHQYELFRMENDLITKDIFFRFTNNVNGLKSSHKT